MQLTELKPNKSILDYLELARLMFNSSETYTGLVEGGYISPCPTMITSSSISTIYYALKGDRVEANISYSAASNPASPYGDPSARSEWLKSEVFRLTGIELALAI